MHVIKKILHHGQTFFFLLTQFVCHCKCCLESIILNNRAAPVRVTHRANIRHAQSVTRVGTAKVLTKQKVESIYYIICSTLYYMLYHKTNTLTYRPGEEHGRVVVLRVAVAWRIVLSLPLAEVAESHGSVG